MVTSPHRYAIWSKLAAMLFVYGYVCFPGIPDLKTVRGSQAPNYNTCTGTHQVICTGGTYCVGQKSECIGLYSKTCSQGALASCVGTDHCDNTNTNQTCGGN